MTRSRGFLLNMLGKEASPTPFVVACTMLDLLVPRLVNDDSPYLDPQLPELKGSIGEGPNQTNYSDQSSVRILAKFRNFR